MFQLLVLSLLCEGVCTVCRPGTFPYHTLDECATCPVGTVSEGGADTVCDPCPGSLIPNPQGSGCLSVVFAYFLNRYAKKCKHNGVC